MSTGSSIEWTDNTWNPVTGCTRVSSGCDRCYAVTMTHRLESMGQEKYSGLTVLNRAGDRHFNGKVKTHEDALDIPLRWRKPRRIFVNSMSDLFHKEVPFEFIDKVFAVMALCPQHTFQVLTKRPERMSEYLNAPDRRERIEELVNEVCPWPLPGVWLGASVENQAAADERIAPLLRCPAVVRFLSCEPLLGPVDISDWFHRMDPDCRDGILIDWIIVGGESGKGARPCDLAWIRGIVDQCCSAGVPCFVKQLGQVPREHFNVFNSGAWPRDQKALADGDDHLLICLKDRKGGDIEEWPADLRVREFSPSQASAEANAEVEK